MKIWYNYWQGAAVAQLVEQLIRNEQVTGSTPASGSIVMLEFASLAIFCFRSSRDALQTKKSPIWQILSMTFCQKIPICQLLNQKIPSWQILSMTFCQKIPICQKVLTYQVIGLLSPFSGVTVGAVFCSGVVLSDCGVAPFGACGCWK